MTLVLAGQIPDVAVLCSDSRSMQELEWEVDDPSSPSGKRKEKCAHIKSDNVDKLMVVAGKYGIGLFGYGDVQGKPILTILKQNLEEESTQFSSTHKLAQYLQEKLEIIEATKTGLMVVGVDDESSIFHVKANCAPVKVNNWIACSDNDSTIRALVNLEPNLNSSAGLTQELLVERCQMLVQATIDDSSVGSVGGVVRTLVVTSTGATVVEHVP